MGRRPDRSFRRSILNRYKMDNIEEILQEKAVRITPMRQLLLEYFIREDKIVGLGELEKAFPRADRITLYRTLIWIFTAQLWRIPGGLALIIKTKPN